jgi:hypothetical protein
LPFPFLVADLEVFRFVLRLGNLLPLELAVRFNANIGSVLDKLKSARLLGRAVAQVIERQDRITGVRMRTEIAAIVTAGGQANSHSGHDDKRKVDR